MLEIYTSAPTNPDTPESATFDDTALLAQEIGYCSAANNDGASAYTIPLYTSFLSYHTVSTASDVVVRFYDDTVDAGGITHGIQYGETLTPDVDYEISGTNVVLLAGGSYQTEYDAIAASSNTNKRFVVFNDGKLLFEDTTFKISGTGDYAVAYDTLYLRAVGNKYEDVQITSGIYHSGTATQKPTVGTASSWLMFSIDAYSGSYETLSWNHVIDSATPGLYKIDLPADITSYAANTSDQINVLQVKGVVPKDLSIPVENFRNVYIQIDSVQRSGH